MKTCSLILSLAALMAMMAGCTTISPAPEALHPVSPPGIFSHAVFGQVLQRFVDDNGRVDYTALAGDTKDLDRYCRLLATYSPDSHPQMFPTTQDRLTYWINAYNAATIKTVLNYYPMVSVTDVRSPLIFFFMPVKKRIYLSAIFDWYKNDFIRWTETRYPARKGSLPAYIRPYLAKDRQAELDAATGSYTIHFFPYDWGLNDA